MKLITPLCSDIKAVVGLSLQDEEGDRSLWERKKKQLLIKSTNPAPQLYSLELCVCVLLELDIIISLSIMTQSLTQHKLLGVL